MSKRFSKDEAAEIFRRAAEASRGLADESDDGLSLEELKEIGAESGISPELIARAAAGVGRVLPAGPPTKSFGVQTSVEYGVELSGPLNDIEWDELVAELRRTFAARGKTRYEGRIREWSNGNLRVIVEPAANGWRFRMRTVKGAAAGFFAMSLWFVVMAAFQIIAAAGDFGASAAVATGLMMVAGVAAAFINASRLAEWRKTRAEQFERMASLALELASRPESAELPSRPEIEVEPFDPDPASESPGRRSRLDASNLDAGDAGADESDHAQSRRNVRQP